MRNHAFESDGTFFDIVAQRVTDPADRKQLEKLAATYRSLAKREKPFPLSRYEFWQRRAEECRTLVDQFKNETCRAQLERLAETYERMAGTYRT